MFQGVASLIGSESDRCPQLRDEVHAVRSALLLRQNPSRQPRCWRDNTT